MRECSTRLAENCPFAARRRSGAHDPSPERGAHRRTDPGSLRRQRRGSRALAGDRAISHDMPARFAQAHLVMARGGASTVAELAASGSPRCWFRLPPPPTITKRAMPR